MKTLAIGFFDGVHCGHQAILDGADIALTFLSHPAGIVAPDDEPDLLMTPAERLAAIRAYGVRDVLGVPFTERFAARTPAEFAADLRVNMPDVGAIRCGPDWRFGAGGAGNAAYLRAEGFKVTEVEPVLWNGERISSTRIREALAQADLASVRAMLGRDYVFTGEPVKGKGLGKRLGFPTVNVFPDLDFPFPFGVYAVRANRVCGVANFGLAPTAGASQWEAPVLEVHFLGKPPRTRVRRVKLVKFLRPEMEFASLDELKRQIAADRARAREIFLAAPEEGDAPIPEL